MRGMGQILRLGRRRGLRLGNRFLLHVGMLLRIRPGLMSFVRLAVILPRPPRFSVDMVVDIHHVAILLILADVIGIALRHTCFGIDSDVTHHIDNIALVTGILIACHNDAAVRT